MKIRSLQVEQFRKFDQTVLVEGFGDGLNIIEGPNETGKSTLLLALRAALFERHNAKSDAIRAFSPHQVTGARPTVTIAFEVGNKRFRLEKSFLKRPSAVLETSDGRRFEGAEAEAELKRLLGLNPAEKSPISKGSPAHFGVLLTPQAQSFQQPAIADGTRHSLEAAIAADIAELGNQSEVDSLLAEFEEMLFDFVSKRGEPKSRYKDVTIRLDAIDQEIAEATEERSALQDELEKLAGALAERSELAAADEREKLCDRLTALEAARVQATERQSLENRRLAASQRLQAAEAKRRALQASQEERQRHTEEIEALEKSAEDAKTQLATTEEALFEREGKLADLGDRLRTARQRRNDLEALGRQFDRLRQIEATLSAFATEVRLDFENAALDRITLNGEAAVSPSECREVTEGLAIEIDGIGRIGIEPKVEPMREALEAKAAVMDETARLSRMLDLDSAEQDVIETAWHTVTADIEALETSRAEFDAKGTEERRLAAEAKAALEASADRTARLAKRLVEIDAQSQSLDQAALDAEIREAKAALEAAERALNASPQNDGPEASDLDTEIAVLRRRMDQRRNATQDIGQKIAALEAVIDARSGRGLDEKLDHLERERHLRAEERDAFALDHEALSLLTSTLGEAAAEAKATFNAPLSARLAPYIRDLVPDASPVVTPEFSIRAIDRNGVEEPFLHLSDGTREQIAILARLAFADMLQEQGLPALIVLDDALAFSDDRRFQQMVAILEKAAERMQVIILTCREERFANAEATRLTIKPATTTESSAA